MNSASAKATTIPPIMFAGLVRARTVNVAAVAESRWMWAFDTHKAFGGLTVKPKPPHAAPAFETAHAPAPA